MIELYVYSTKISPENQDVFQLLKEITFRKILAFYSSRKWGHFGGICGRPGALGLTGSNPRYKSRGFNAYKKDLDLSPGFNSGGSFRTYDLQGPNCGGGH